MFGEPVRDQISLTSGDELEEEFSHCQSETSTTSPEACQIRTSSGEQLQEGHTLKLSQPSSHSKPLDSKKMNVIHLSSNVPATDNQLRNRLVTSADPALSQL